MLAGKWSRTFTTTLIAICVISLSVPTYVIAKWVWWESRGEQLYVKKKQAELIGIHKPDEVLTASRQVLASWMKYRPDPNWHPISPTHLDPQDPTLPTAIRNLNPKAITVDAGTSLTLEFGGGQNHFGLRAFAAGVSGYGNKELIHGLWFYGDFDLTK